MKAFLTSLMFLTICTNVFPQDRKVFIVPGDIPQVPPGEHRLGETSVLALAKDEKGLVSISVTSRELRKSLTLDQNEFIRQLLICEESKNAVLAIGLDRGSGSDYRGLLYIESPTNESPSAEPKFYWFASPAERLGNRIFGVTDIKESKKGPLPLIQIKLHTLQLDGSYGYQWIEQDLRKLAPLRTLKISSEKLSD